MIRLARPAWSPAIGVAGAVLLWAAAACDGDALYRSPEPPVPEDAVAPEDRIVVPEGPAVEFTPLEPPEPLEVPCEDDPERVVVARPLDVVLIVDNSASMADEISAVQDNINDNFARIIAASGIDYRVVMLSSHGTIDPSASSGASQSICVRAPLSATDCAPVPQAPAPTERFRHYSVEIGSWDAWCKILQTIDGSWPDRFAFSEDGWRAWLRADSVKVFAVITDDGVNCAEGGAGILQDLDAAPTATQVAGVFDDFVRRRWPEHFEDVEGRNYVWHSIVGMDGSVEPDGDEIVEAISASADSAGTGHQALSVLTGGLRLPVENPDGFDVLFTAIAESSIETVIERTRCD